MQARWRNGEARLSPTPRVSTDHELSLLHQKLHKATFAGCICCLVKVVNRESSRLVDAHGVGEGSGLSPGFGML